MDSLKIEGRIKGAHYVYTVVENWRKNINTFIETGELYEDDSNLHKVFNRGLTNKFLKGNLTKDMFIDNPRDNSVNYAVDQSNAIDVVQIQEVKQELYTDKNAIGATLEEKVKSLSIDKIAITIAFKAVLGEPLTVIITPSKDDQETFEVKSTSLLSEAGQKSITSKELEKRFKGVITPDYLLEGYDFSELGDNLAVPFRELSELKEKVAFLLNGSKEVIKHTDVAALVQQPKVEEKPTLSMLISDVADLNICDVTDADIYFKLPESFKKRDKTYINIFLENPRLIPWFPAVLIGKDYDEAVKVLEEAKPTRIVTNNTGIAYKAFEMGIAWIAGPLLNTTNSHALITMKEALNCAGAFISNEINKGQIKHIRRPENFKLVYSIYHPILMMTSRQCFFQQTVGCNKPSIEAGCMLKCEKATTITNVKGISFAVDKQKGGYPSIYNHEQFLNMDIVTDLSDLFDEFFIDLTNIGGGSKEQANKVELVKHFEKLLNGDTSVQEELFTMVPINTNDQYQQGL